MNILFIENRYKTYTLEAVGKMLEKDGHTISFLIQNKQFQPESDFNYFVIPLPKKQDLKKDYGSNDEVEKVIVSDRMQNFFEKKGKQYFYYYNEKISEIIDKVKPDFVFGESTAFHELLTIYNCKKRDILYLHPSSCRYPKNRFSFYKYDTLEPYKGSGEELPKEKALNIINSIVNRSAKPDYMNKIKTDKAKVIKDKLLKVQSYIKGDTYNTPNPIVKYKIEKQKKLNIKLWDDFAHSEIKNSSDLLVLYPLQMQPEANIDVWGQKYRDQLALIKRLSNLLPNDAKLVVKPNPKSKYELTDVLINFVKDNSSIIPLAHHVKMDDILEDINLIVTVTGTIAIESILSNIPIVTLVKTLNNKQNNCKFIDNLEELLKVVNDIKEEKFPKIPQNEKVAYLNTLNKTSYEGRVSDPFSFEKVFNEKNMKDLYNAFNHIIS